VWLSPLATNPREPAVQRITAASSPPVGRIRDDVGPMHASWRAPCRGGEHSTGPCRTRMLSPAFLPRATVPRVRTARRPTQPGRQVGSEAAADTTASATKVRWIASSITADRKLLVHGRSMHLLAMVRVQANNAALQRVTRCSAPTETVRQLERLRGVKAMPTSSPAQAMSNHAARQSVFNGHRRHH